MDIPWSLEGQLVVARNWAAEAARKTEVILHDLNVLNSDMNDFAKKVYDAANEIHAAMDRAEFAAEENERLSVFLDSVHDRMVENTMRRGRASVRQGPRILAGIIPRRHEMPPPWIEGYAAHHGHSNRGEHPQQPSRFAGAIHSDDNLDQYRIIVVRHNNTEIDNIPVGELIYDGGAMAIESIRYDLFRERVGAIEPVRYGPYRFQLHLYYVDYVRASARWVMRRVQGMQQFHQALRTQLAHRPTQDFKFFGVFGKAREPRVPQPPPR